MPRTLEACWVWLGIIGATVIGCGGSEVQIGERNLPPTYDGGDGASDSSNDDEHMITTGDGAVDGAVDAVVDTQAPTSCAAAGGRCISAGSVCFGGPTPDAIRATCGDPSRMVCCAPSAPMGDGSTDADADADARAVDARSDGQTADANGDGSSASACVAAGGKCIPPPFNCLFPLDPSLVTACGDPQVLRCCTSPPIYDGGRPPADAMLGPSCTEAGGTCHSTGSICFHGSLPTTSCGNPDMWMCCAP